jgi:hypothetical protein
MALETLLQPAENLRYLNYVADKFDRSITQFNCRVPAHFDEAANQWRLGLETAGS